MEIVLPISVNPSEEIKLYQQAVNFSVKYGEEEIYSLGQGIFVLTTQRILFFQNEPRKVCLYIPYPNCITHGINKTELYCIISDLSGVEQEDDNEEEEADPIIEKLKLVNSFEDENIINLVGNYEIVFDFKDSGIDKLDGVFSLLSECSAMNPDDLKGDEANIFDNEFITADDIDENGNVILNNSEDDEDDFEDGNKEIKDDKMDIE